MNNTLKYSIIGLPGSGKTTFLAALWHQLISGEISGRYLLDEHIGDHTHLNGITTVWQGCEEVSRTPLGALTSIHIKVRCQSTGKRAVISFPDVSGEVFELLLSSRTSDADYVASLNESSGVLLFVTANRPLDGISIADVAGLDIETPRSDEPFVEIPWQPSTVSMQVKIVELLQLLHRRPFLCSGIRIAVLISAWDLVQPGGISALEWIAREMPFLHQYLETNQGVLEFRAYGISAQGGDFSKQRAELLEMVPAERILCEGLDAIPHDLTSPISWLMRD